MDPPLTPRSGGRRIAEGAATVAVDLKVDPPNVGMGRISGGDGGLSQVVDGINKRPGDAGVLDLTLGANFRAHHVGVLAAKIERAPGAPLPLRLTLRDSEALSWDAAGKAPKWKDLAANPHILLLHVDVSGCDLEDSPSPKVYLGPLADACPSLESVALRHLGAWLEGGDDEIFDFQDYLVGVLRKPCLKEIDLTHCKLGSYEMITNALKTPKGDAGYAGVERLHLSWNGLGPHVGLLRSFTRLRALRFGKNPMNAEQVADLAGYLRELEAPLLEELELNDNNLGPAGGDAVLAALAARDGLPLTHLGLHGNSLTDAPLCHLRSHAFDRLRVLDISGNGVTAAGIEALLGIVKDGYLPALEELNLSDNPLGTAQPILSATARLRHVTINLFESIPAGMKTAAASLRAALAAPLGNDAGAYAVPVVVDGTLYASLAEVAAAGVDDKGIAEALAVCGEYDGAVLKALEAGEVTSTDERVARVVARYAELTATGGAKATEDKPKPPRRRHRIAGGEYVIGYTTKPADVEEMLCAAEATGGPLRLVSRDGGGPGNPAPSMACLLDLVKDHTIVAMTTSYVKHKPRLHVALTRGATPPA